MKSALSNSPCKFMQLKLLYLLFFIIFASACANKNSAPTPVLVPSGTFTGEFRIVHNNIKTGTHDTLTALVELVLNKNADFTVKGDTSAIQAGSSGSYGVNTNYIQFVDATAQRVGSFHKTHLNGIYRYYYDGNVFQMLAASKLDTLELQYDMKRAAQ